LATPPEPPPTESNVNKFVFGTCKGKKQLKIPKRKTITIKISKKYYSLVFSQQTIYTIIVYELGLETFFYIFTPLKI
jgi:hypothetical protein